MYKSKEGFVRSRKHIVAPWIASYQDTSFKRPGHRILIKGLLGKYARSLRNWGYYAAKSKKLTLDHSYYINLPLAPHHVVQRYKFDVTSENKVNLFSRSFQKEHGDKYTLPLTSRCKFDGLVPYARSRIKQRFDIGDVDFHEFLRDTGIQPYPEDKNTFGYMALPGYEGMMEDLRKYTKPIDVTFTKEDLYKAVNYIKSELKLPKCEPPTKDSLKTLYVNDKSYSGLLTALFAGHTKKESLAFSTLIAEHLFDVAGASLTVDTSIKCVGAREKLVSDSKMAEKLSTRALIQEESCISQLKQAYSRPITEGFKLLNKNWESPIGIGGQLLGAGVFNFVERFYPKDLSKYKLVTMDASSHDKNVHHDLLIMAYSILRACYPQSDLIDKHFFFFMSGHVSKRIMTDDGLIFRIEGGIQTGDPFTSLLTSVCMLLEKTILYQKLGMDMPIARTYYGDDQIELFDIDAVIPENLSALSQEIIGISMRDVIVKNLGEEFSDDFSSEPSFLQMYFKNGLTVRDPNRIIEKLTFIDQKVREDKELKLDAVASMTYSSIGDNEAKSIIFMYCDWLVRKYKIYLISSVASKTNATINNLSIANSNFTTDNIRGEYVYKRKERAYCDMYIYDKVKHHFLPILPIYSEHILGIKREKNIHELLLKMRTQKSFVASAKKEIMAHLKRKNMHNLHFFLQHNKNVVGN